MKDSNPKLKKEVAWNGIRFLSPIDWEIGKIGNQYLVLEDEDGPVMEVKWRRVKGKFSPQAQLQRLAVLHNIKPGVVVKKIPVPSGWKEIIDQFESECFSWHGKTIGGIGTVLYCPKCQTSTLLQFFQRKAHMPEDLFARILDSFQDHPHNDRVAWAVFDIRARIPGEFRLSRYRFEPGAFELIFSRGKDKIMLYRWGPASILLRRADLLQNASEMFGIPQTDLRCKKADGQDIVDSSISFRSGGWAGIRNIIGTKHVYTVSRMWHLKDKNRLLGVKMDGKQPVDSGVFEQVCRFYECI